MTHFVVPTIVVAAVGSLHLVRDALKEGSVAVCQVGPDLPASPLITRRSFVIMRVKRLPQI